MVVVVDCYKLGMLVQLGNLVRLGILVQLGMLVRLGILVQLGMLVWSLPLYRVELL